MNYIKENIKEFSVCNIQLWHNLGYTGKNIKIGNTEKAYVDSPLFHSKVHDVYGNYRYSESSNHHGNQTAHVIHQVAPDSDIYCLNMGFNQKNNVIYGTLPEITMPMIKDLGISVISSSSWMPTSFKKVNNYVKDLRDNLVLVSAAGNDGSEGLDGYGVTGDWFAVGAVGFNDVGDEIFYKNYSSRGEELDYCSFSGLYIPHFGQYYGDTLQMEGTSFAAPMFSGMCALVQQFFLEKVGRVLSHFEMERFINDNLIDLGKEGWNDYFGHGLFVLPNPRDINISKYTNGIIIEPEKPIEDNPPTNPIEPIEEIMSKTDYNTYINYKAIYDNAKRDGNKVATDYAKQLIVEILNKYGINSDDYFNDTPIETPPIKPEPIPEPPKEEPIIKEPIDTPVPPKENSQTDILIAICDGHGMETAGKRTPLLPSGAVMKENEFNRAVKRYLDIELKGCGFKTLLVAPGDTDVPLKQRTDLANTNKADIYVSVHANAFDGKFDDYDPSGVETYHFPNSIKGKKLADIIHKHLIKGTKQINRGVKSADFYVLRETNMPAVLVEAGFMDNLEEAKLLLSDSFRKEVATEVAMGICEYYNIPYIQKTTEPVTPTQMPILSKPTATIPQMQEWARSKNANQLLIDLAPVFYSISVNVGINPVVTYCQSAKETGYMNFGGVLDASYNNPCGMKNSSGGGDYDPNAHKRFANWEEGIQAQVDHLALYAGAIGYPKQGTPDPRHFPYLHGSATTVESLSGKWAPSSEYGNSIVRMAKEVESTIVEIVEPEPTPSPEPAVNKIELIDIKIKLHSKDNIIKGIHNEGINYIPIRFLEQLGYSVEWNDRTIEIDYKI